MIIFPTLFQLYLYWMYSSIYKGYIRQKFSEEHQKYSDSLKGIAEGEKSKIDPVYLEVWTDVLLAKEGRSDETITKFTETLNRRLIKAASPSPWELGKSYLSYKWKYFFKKEKNEIILPEERKEVLPSTYVNKEKMPLQISKGQNSNFQKKKPKSGKNKPNRHK